MAAVSLPYWDWTSERAIGEGIPPALSDPTHLDPDSGETKANPLASAFSQVTGANTRRFPGDPNELEFLKEQVDFAQSVPVYPDYSPALENPHGGLHVWVGGDMGRVPTAAYDPIFWLHHCNIDRLWYEWQKEHGDDTVPDDVRQFVCTPFSYTGEQTLSTVPFGYTYADSEASATQDQGLSMGAAAAVPLPPSASFAMTGIDPVFSLARLEFHAVQKTENSYQVRVFCDRQAGAYDASMERRGNSSYANTLYLFGHGECVGADGHCTRPEGPRAWFDRRPPHHLTPFNTYLDVTEAVKNAMADGSGSVDLSFVVLDADGKQVDPAHIRFDRISLVTYK